MRIPARLRQWLYPREFRIDGATWAAAQVPFVERATMAVLEDAASAPGGGRAPTAGIESSVDFLADVCTGLWRLRGRMVDPGTDRPREDLRRAYRHVESMWNALAAAGVQILDHTGTAFDAGLDLKVLAYQPTSGITRERVMETIKPTVYFNRVRLQMGEVIVATPERTVEGEERVASL